MHKISGFGLNNVMRRCHRSVCLCVNEISHRIIEGRPVKDDKMKRYEECFNKQIEIKRNMELSADDCLEKLFKN
jgi:hypothetical protein